MFIILNNITAFCSGQTPFFITNVFLLVHHDDDGDDEGLQLDYFLHFYIRIPPKAKEPDFSIWCERYYFGGNLRPQGVTVREYKEKYNPTKHEENCHNGNQWLFLFQENPGNACSVFSDIYLFSNIKPIFRHFAKMAIISTCTTG